MDRTASQCILTAATLLAAGPGFADGFPDTARVLSAAPVYSDQRVSSSQCRQVLVQATPDNATGSQIFGGILGGLLGSRFGHGTGRVAASAAGAITGAVVGDKLASNDDGERWETRCTPVERRQPVLSGYDVTYRYAGQVMHAMLPYDPGDTLPVQVSVRPAGRPG